MSKAMTAHQRSVRLKRLREQLDAAGHRAYSMDGFNSKGVATPAAVRAFERVDKIKARIKEVEAEQE